MKNIFKKKIEIEKKKNANEGIPMLLLASVPRQLYYRHT